MGKCLWCGKETDYDWCCEEHRRCLKCGNKLEPEDDIYCILCSMGVK